MSVTTREFFLAFSVVLVMVCLNEIATADRCDVYVPEPFLISAGKKFLRWIGILNEEVEASKDPTCDICDYSQRGKGKRRRKVATRRDSRSGCRCGKGRRGTSECGCCFHVEKWDILICFAAGLVFKNATVYVVLTVEDFVIFRYGIQLKKLGKLIKKFTKFLSCIPFPPPVSFLSGCLTPAVEFPTEENDYYWQICGSLEVGLLQYPVLTLVTKCFEVGPQMNSMRIEGQTDPETDVDDPAIAQVEDEDNYDSAVCLTNDMKQKTEAMNEGKLPAPEPIEMRERVNWRESHKGDVPPYLAVLYQRGSVRVGDISGELKQFPYIQGVLSKTEDKKWLGNSKADDGFEQPAKSCGGVLLTKNKVLTICACIRTFYFLNKLDKPPKRDVYPFDIESPAIYMDVPGIVFEKTESYRLDPDPKKFMAESECARHITDEHPYALRSLMMVMAFLPSIRTPRPGRFVQWPPKKLKRGQRVDMVSFGMEPQNKLWVFVDSENKTIDLQRQAVNVFLRRCPLSNYSETELMKSTEREIDITKKVAGFCTRENPSQLCYGIVGYPLVSGRDLMGLTALPIDCASPGTTAGTIFDPETVREIESYLSLSESHERTSRAESFILNQSWNWFVFLVASLGPMLSAA